MVFAGTDVRMVQSVLGLSVASTTMNLYLHSFQKAQVMATEAIATALERKKAPADAPAQTPPHFGEEDPENALGA